MVLQNPACRRARTHAHIHTNTRAYKILCPICNATGVGVSHRLTRQTSCLREGKFARGSDNNNRPRGIHTPVHIIQSF